MNQINNTHPVLLMIDDDREDIYLTKRAFNAHNSNVDFRSVLSGDDLFDYLNCSGDFTGNTLADRPDVLLLDINIPKENGFSLLKRLKEQETHCHLPVTMLTTSRSSDDVRKAYQLGASSFICKSPTASAMGNIAEKFCSYWFGFAELPRC